MEFKKEFSQHAVKRVLLQETKEQSIDSTISLPEYYPELAHVLKCSMEPQIYSVQTGSEAVTIEGAACLRILYCSGENTLRCFTHFVPFMKTVEDKFAPEAFSKVCAKTDYINCRVQSPRKIDLHGAISLSVSTYLLEMEHLLCGCTGGSVQTKQAEIETSTLLGATEKLFTLEETLELSEAQPSVAEIISVTATPDVQTIKLVSGKALLKGSVALQTTYLAEGASAPVETMTHTLPINQILEVSGAEEGGTADSTVWISAVEVHARTDGGGSQRLLEAKLHVGVSLDLYKTCKQTILLDAYSTQYALQCETKPLQLPRLLDTLHDTHLYRETIELNGVSVEKMLSVRCEKIESTVLVKEGIFHADGTIYLELLYMTSEKTWEMQDKKLPFSYTRAVAYPEEETNVHAQITFGGTEYILHAADRVEVRVELDIDAMLVSNNQYSALSDMTLSDDAVQQKNAPALTIYFAKSGETLWDIARRYNTTVSAVQTENHLQGDALETACTLLIPRV